MGDKHMKLIEESIEELRNGEKVCFLKTVKNRDKFALVACLDGNRVIPLSEFRDGDYYEDSQMLLLKEYLGDEYFADFVIDPMEIFAVNTSKLSKFMLLKNNDAKTVKIVVAFGDYQPKALCNYDKAMAEELKEEIDYMSARKFMERE